MEVYFRLISYLCSFLYGITALSDWGLDIWSYLNHKMIRCTFECRSCDRIWTMDVYNLDGREYGAITRQCYTCRSTAVSVEVSYECFSCGRSWEALRNDEGLACYGCGLRVRPKKIR